MEVRDGYAPLARLLLARTGDGGTLRVGIAGGVAVGKSTAAAAVQELLAPRAVEVVATDGFLLPNTALESRGILHRKGFPESYDVAAAEAFLDAVQRGERDVSVPVYSHVTYDIVAERTPVPPADVVILEGVNALQFADRLDVAVYLHATEAAMERWYVDRFLELCSAPPPGSFYEQFAVHDPGAQRSLARDVWRGVNRVNLRECILGTRAHADIVVSKRDDHSVARTDLVTPA
jgi:type I pantothenate kinase